MDKILAECEIKMKQRIEALDKELSRVRVGRANLNILDGIKVSYYGTMTPLSQVASLSAPDARTIVISPFEKKILGDIEKAIQIADIGIQPGNDGNVIRLPIPPLNQERRQEIAKSIKKHGEEAKILLRKVRQDTNALVKKQEKDRALSEDDSKKLQKAIQTSTDKFVALIDSKIEKKESEILTL
jgi:ribosome recycling factor